MYILMIIERWVLLPFFTKTDFKDRGAIGPLNGKKGQNGPFCGHNHMRWCGFEIAECVNHFVAFFSPENRRVPSRSNFAPCCATPSGWPRLPTARILHLWPFHPKTVLAVQPGCVLSRSSLVLNCATRSGSPRLPTARTLHLWPFWGLFQPLWLPRTAIPGPKIGSTLLLGHWYEIMALYYVKSILTEISASRQDRRVLQKSKIIKIEFLSKWGMLQTSRYV